MDNKQMIKEIKELILELCKGKKWDWESHIKNVVKYAEILSKKANAKWEIVEIAAWMHDISKIKDSKIEGHHIRGSEEAGRILREYNYPEDKIKEVQHCIITHSSDREYSPESKEARVLAGADTLALIDDFLGLAYFVYHKKGYSVEKGRQSLITRYKSYWHKLSFLPEAKEMARKKFEGIKQILGEEHFE